MDDHTKTAIEELAKRIDDLERRVAESENTVEACHHDEEDDYYEVTCANCGHTFIANFEDFAEDRVICPQCESQFHLDDATLEKLQDHDEHHH